MDRELLKVGELAARAGITVRTLHHYHELGLLIPGRRTATGYRLYGEEEVRRLQRILSLRRLGFSLREIGACLEDEEYSVEGVLDLHIQHLDTRIERARRLQHRLRRIREQLQARGEVSTAALLDATKAIATFEKYFTTDQRARLAVGAGRMGRKGLGEAEAAWGELFGRFGAAMEAGADPESPAAQELARQARDLIRGFTEGDPEMEESLTKMYRAEGPERVLGRFGLRFPPGLWDYMSRARAALERTDGLESIRP